MIICMGILLLLCFLKLRFSKFHMNYMSMEQTTSIKGVFAVIIFLSHIRQYIDKLFIWDSAVIVFLNVIGQLMVAVFFFYSGYGIMRSFSHKKDYSLTFFKNRILKILIHFDIAVLLYLLLALITGTNYTIFDYLLAWSGWTSLGNSNWFVFVMLSLYVITQLVFIAIESRVAKNRGIVVAFCISVLSALLWLSLFLAKKQAWWYNTLLCYPLGMWFALYKERIDALFAKSLPHTGMYLIVIPLFAVLYLAPNEVTYSLCACSFCILITLVTTNVKVDNAVLRWLGQHAFEIYIIQRLPMIALTACGLSQFPHIFFLLAITATFGLAIILKKVYCFVDIVLFHQGKK